MAGIHKFSIAEDDCAKKFRRHERTVDRKAEADRARSFDGHEPRADRAVVQIFTCPFFSKDLSFRDLASRLNLWPYPQDPMLAVPGAL